MINWECCDAIRWSNSVRQFNIPHSEFIIEFGIGAGPCATESCEPRQVRKEATVSGQVCVPQDHLAPLSALGEC